MWTTRWSVPSVHWAQERKRTPSSYWPKKSYKATPVSANPCCEGQAQQLRVGTVSITNNESRHSCVGTGMGVHQKLTRSSKSAAGLTFRDTLPTSKGIPKNNRICITLLDPWFRGGACHILIVWSHPFYCWATCCGAVIFSKAGLTRGADPQASTRG